MRAVSSQVVADPPSVWIRLAGFVCVAAGAILAGVGATRAWASIRFPADTQGVADVQVFGTDVWEGKFVILASVTCLLLVFASRLTASSSTRRGLAIALFVLGAACIALPVAGAVRAEDRFGGGGGLDRMAQTLSRELGLPEEVVREQLAEQFERELRVDVEPGLWLTTAGAS